MSTQVTLKASRRDESGKGVARKLRAAGKLPAVVYGGPDETVPVVLDAHETTNLFHSISVENTIVNLEVEGEKVPVPSLVREIQTHPYRSQILHVDFFRIQEGVEVELEVPIHLDGIPTGVKDDGGVLEQTIYMLPVRCLPTAIPEEFLVDVTGLEIHDSLHVEELDLPEGVTVLLDPSRTVCSVQAPSMAEVEVEEVEEEEPELIGAEEGEEDAEAPAAEAEDEGEEPES